jgi:D-alanyl-D-alanine carboxypeptidase
VVFSGDPDVSGRSELTDRATVRQDGAMKSPASIGALVVWLWLSGAGFGQTPADVGPTLATIIEREHVPGIAAAALQGDRIVAQGVAGVRKKGDAAPVTLEDAFQISSCTKAMTATLTALLIGDGQLKWSTTLPEIFKDEISSIDSQWAQVTVRSLLAQRSGIEGDHPITLLRCVWSARGNASLQRRMVATKLLAHSPDGPPAGKFSYSNLNYILLGAALEKLTGRTWEELMRERLFAALSLPSAGFGPPGGAGRIDQPWGHGRWRLCYVPISPFGSTPFDPGSSNADFPAVYGPAGTVHVNVLDWAKFVGMQLKAHPENPQRAISLLRPEIFDQFYRSEAGETEYISGWFLGTRSWARGSRPADEGRVLYHEGSNGRWTSMVWIAPEIDFAMVVVCNRAHAVKACDAVAQALLHYRPAGIR